MRGRVTVIVAVTTVLAAAASGCGGESAAPAGPPPRVAPELAPKTLSSQTLVVAADDKADKAFKTLGPTAVVSDGRLWTIRGAGDRLVGTLQISTLKLKVDVSDEEQRDGLIKTIIPGPRETLSVGGVEVIQSRGDDKKTVYLWFGDRLFEVLQLKSTKAVTFEPERILTEVVGYQKAQPQWKPVPKKAGDDRAGDATDDGEEEDEG